MIASVWIDAMKIACKVDASRTFKFVCIFSHVCRIFRCLLFI